MIANSRVFSIAKNLKRIVAKAALMNNEQTSTLTIRSFSGSSSLASIYPYIKPQHAVNNHNRFQYLCRENQRSKLCAILLRQSSSSMPPERLFQEELNILYDSQCNVCKLEMDFLARRDTKLAIEASRPRKLKLTDLEDETYNPDEPANGGVPYADGMASIHAVRHNGEVVEGVAVFSAAYELVGLGWLLKLAEWPVTQPLFKLSYDVFAKYRTNVTRGSSLETLVEAYEARQNFKQPPGDCGTCDSPFSEKQ